MTEKILTGDEIKQISQDMIENDINWLNTKLTTMSNGVIAVLTYRLGMVAYRILANLKDNPDSEKVFDDITEKIQAIVTYLNTKEFGKEISDKINKPKRDTTGNPPVIEWLKK